MAVERTVYGLGPLTGEDDVSPVYKIEEETDGTVWVYALGWFNDRETAHAFCRAWNGEPGPA